MMSSTTPTPPVKEKRVSDLDLNNTNRGVWLVKVPKYLSDRWEDAEDNRIVGKLQIERLEGRKPIVSFMLEEDLAAEKEKNGKTEKEVPRAHKFVMNSLAAQTLTVFSNLSSKEVSDQPTPPDKLAIEGRVVQRADCRPVSDNTYMQLKKTAILEAIEPKRKTVQLDRAVNAYKPVANHASNIINAARKKEEGKKSRDDKEKVMEMLFALFEKHQYYNIKDLVKETRQPYSYLKEILKEVCTYKVKNPNKNTWELKPEYRHYHKPEPEKEEKSDDDSSDDE